MGEPRRWNAITCHSCGVILGDQKRVDDPGICSHLTAGLEIPVREDGATETDIEAVNEFLKRFTRMLPVERTQRAEELLELIFRESSNV